MADCRFDRDDAGGRIVLFKPLANAHYGARGAEAGYESAYPAACLLDYFRAGGFVVRERVGRIGKLVGHVVLAWLGLHHALRLYYGAVGHAAACRKHQVRAEGHKYAAALHADAFGHAEGYPVAHGHAHHGESYARVPTGRLEDGFVRSELAALHGFFTHIISGSVLYGTAGVGPFEFYEDGDPRIGREVPKAHHWSVPNGRGDPGIS